VRTTRRTSRTTAPTRGPLDDDFALSPAQNRELVRRLRDQEDRTRYLVVSVLAGKLLLFYDVSTDTYIWKDPRGATLFKRRAAALAIKRLLRGNVRVVACRVDRRDRLIRSSVALGLAGATARQRSSRR
jgi:hypothetical protein